MEWISVEDRLPERVAGARYSQVACLVCHHGEIKILVFNHEHLCWDDESFDDFYCQISDVTHWMPLPEPPKVEALKDEHYELCFGKAVAKAQEQATLKQVGEWLNGDCTIPEHEMFRRSNCRKCMDYAIESLKQGVMP